MAKPKVVLFDLWQTLIYSLSVDPILTVQVLLDGEALSMHPEFVTACLTNSTKRPKRFLEQVSQRTGRQASPEQFQKFRELLAAERAGVTVYDDVLPTIAALKAEGIRIGVISNLWPFAVNRIEKLLDAKNSFEHVVYSCEVGLRKPDEPIFKLAADLFDVDPADCLMVGDSTSSDYFGSTGAGMQAVLIDRERLLKTIPEGARVITSLTELL